MIIFGDGDDDDDDRPNDMRIMRFNQFCFYSRGLLDPWSDTIISYWTHKNPMHALFEVIHTVDPLTLVNGNDIMWLKTEQKQIREDEKEIYTYIYYP